LLLEPGYFVMERGMLRGIRRRAEACGQRGSGCQVAGLSSSQTRSG
jgi:hypothetical protein